MIIRSRTALLIGATALALTACGGGDDTATAGGAIEVPAAPDASAGAGTSTSQPGEGADATGAGPAGLPPRPQRDSCVDIPEAADGRYTVYEAGFAVITREGDRLVLGEVQAADGWTARVDDDGGDEVEIDFRRGGEDVLDLEVELDDGRVKAEICADDD